MCAVHVCYLYLPLSFFYYFNRTFSLVLYSSTQFCFAHLFFFSFSFGILEALYVLLTLFCFSRLLCQFFFYFLSFCFFFCFRIFRSFFQFSNICVCVFVFVSVSVCTSTRNAGPTGIIEGKEAKTEKKRKKRHIVE